MDNEKIIYNLALPDYFNSMTISGYTFDRLPEYESRYGGMMCLVDSSGSEFPTNKQTGSHQATAITREPNEAAILPWGGEEPTHLDDILLVLSIFTGRHVFAVNKNVYESNPTLVSDHRTFNFGGVLQCSLPRQVEFFNPDTQEPLTEEEIRDDQYHYENQRNVGDINGINNVLTLIKTTNWRSKYADGYYLILFEKALHRMYLEAQFLLCWIIWEHLFAVLKKDEYTEEQLENIDGKTKICFLITTYFPITLNADSRRQINRMKKARNKLVHYGQKPNNVEYSEMDLFIRMTEYLICKTLDLTPSNLFNTDEKLARFLQIRQ